MIILPSNFLQQVQHSIEMDEPKADAVGRWISGKILSNNLVELTLK